MPAENISTKQRNRKNMSDKAVVVYIKQSICSGKCMPAENISTWGIQPLYYQTKLPTMGRLKAQAQTQKQELFCFVIL